MNRALPTLLLLVLGACSAGDAEMRDGTPDDSDNGSDVDSDTESPVASPRFWQVSGQLAIAGGQPIAVQSDINLAFFDGSADPWQNDEEQSSRCDLKVVEAAVLDEPPEDPDVQQWYTLALEMQDESPCPWSVPMPEAASHTELPQVYLGVGAFDSQLLPALAAAELNTDADLYGLYVLHPDLAGDTVYIFGVAGTQAQFDGSEDTVDEPPVADGSYLLQPLFMLPVPE